MQSSKQDLKAAVTKQNNHIGDVNVAGLQKVEQAPTAQHTDLLETTLKKVSFNHQPAPRGAV